MLPKIDHFSGSDYALIAAAKQYLTHVACFCCAVTACMSSTEALAYSRAASKAFDVVLAEVRSPMSAMISHSVTAGPRGGMLCARDCFF